MRRVSRRSCEDGPLLEDQETEGQRQLHSLLLQQLHTHADVERCVAKRQCFTPAALYQPFGDQAAGVRSLSQFQDLQDGEKELADLRELGLTDAEIQLWLNRSVPEPAEKSHGICAAPSAKRLRLQAVRDKIAARAELRSRPHRFATSRPLSRREMEIEQALFQGNDRLSFLTALYHRDDNHVNVQQGASLSDPMDCLYREVFMSQRASLQDSEKETRRTADDQSEDCHRDSSQSEEVSQPQSKLQDGNRCVSVLASLNSNTAEEGPEESPPHAWTQININQPIGSLCGTVRAGPSGPLTVRGAIETITDEEILRNRETEEVIRGIPRFKNYHPGTPSKVLCVRNLSKQASLAQLVALFSRFEQERAPPLRYRLLTGRMRGQAFITLPDPETAQKALRLVHGYQGFGKPLVVEFGREQQEEGQEMK